MQTHLQKLKQIEKAESPKRLSPKKNLTCLLPIIQSFQHTKILSEKNIELCYYCLYALSVAFDLETQIIMTQPYQQIMFDLISQQEFKPLLKTPIFQQYSYKIWQNQFYPLSLRDKTIFYKIISNWIVSFELRSGKLDLIQSQVQLIKKFMNQETETQLERIVLIEEIFEDLKQLLNTEFWQCQTKARDNRRKLKEMFYKKIRPKSQESIKQFKVQKSNPEINGEQQNIQSVLALMAMLISQKVVKIGQISEILETQTFKDNDFENYMEFIRNCIYYILSFPLLTHQQTELTKLVLIYLRWLSEESIHFEQNYEQFYLIEILEEMMLKTSKMVRFALVVEYIEFYQYLQEMGYDLIVQKVEDMIYFRQLIIGKNIIQQNLTLRSVFDQSMVANQHTYIKAGKSKKVYFSNEFDGLCVLKLDINLKQYDISLKITHFNSLPSIFNKQQKEEDSLKNIVQSLNSFDCSKVRNFKEQMYWNEEKCSSKKLQINLKKKGLYGLQFSNVYSWIYGKDLTYRIELFVEKQNC